MFSQEYIYILYNKWQNTDKKYHHQRFSKNQFNEMAVFDLF